jgi:hypothetical protein
MSYWDQGSYMKICEEKVSFPKACHNDTTSEKSSIVYPEPVGI